MPPKSTKTNTTDKTSDFDDGYESFVPPCYVFLKVTLIGDPPGPGDWLFLVMFNGSIVLDGKWVDGTELEIQSLPLNLKEVYYQAVVADKPLIFILRTLAGKGAKDPDPLLHADNRAGATVDLFPLVLGEEQVVTIVTLLDIVTGANTSCSVEVSAITSEPLEDVNIQIPLILTMVSGHCLPFAKDGTVYLSAIGLNDVLEPRAVNFGMSVSSSSAKKVVWATASNAGQAANTAISVPDEDVFMPEDLIPDKNEECRSFYWNAMKRVLVDAELLKTRLESPFFIELAGVPRLGKIDVRGRYMGFVDARALLEPGQFSLTTSARLKFYNEIELPANMGPLLELPPTSAKATARDTEFTMDEFGHSSYVILRFDLFDPLVPKVKVATLFETIGLDPIEGPTLPVDELEVEPPPEDPTIDVRRIRKEGGALAVHKELSGLACRGAVPMVQGIKRTAANRLLMRVRAMLKQFPPGDCSYVEWQDTVTGQHTASRRAVTSSFAPQPPPIRPPAPHAAARCRIAGDTRIADIHISNNLKVAGGHPRSLLSKALRCLEARNDLDAKNYIVEGLSAQPRNRYLLWLFGGQEFDKGREASEMASAALRIAVKGDCSDGTSNAIGWAALHALYHFNGNVHSAFIAAKKMRKCYELLHEWRKFVGRWTEISGEEEIFWVPGIISQYNPLVIASAFFLCLRCYKFSEILLKCVESECGTKGSRLGSKTKITADISYLRAASLILRRQGEKALEVTSYGIKRFGPSAVMSQMKLTCLTFLRGWDEECEKTLKEAENAGAEVCPALLLRAAMGGIKSDVKNSLQRAARAHQLAPSAHSALAISRIFLAMGEELLAENWAGVSVKTEPLLADGWAVLTLIAMRQRNLDKARTMLRTAREVGPISPEIEQDINKLSDVLDLQSLPDALVKNLCLCEYY